MWNSISKRLTLQKYARFDCDLSTVCPWLFYGLSMIFVFFLWFVYGFPLCISVIRLWIVYELSMICLWFVYGLSMVCLWFVYDLSMICLWFVYGLSMICLWFVYGLSMICLWFVYGLSMFWHPKTTSNPRHLSHSLGPGWFFFPITLSNLPPGWET